MHRKYQIAQQIISAKGDTVEFDVDLEKGYDQVAEIAIFTDPDTEQNLNLEMVERLTIDDHEVYPRKFATALLHPAMFNPTYRKVAMPTGEKSKLKVAARDTSDVVASPYTVNILITLTK